MDARSVRAALVACILMVCMGANYRTPNFIIETARPDLAEKLAKAAETYRRDLAIAWLGEAMPQWSQPCMVTVHAGPNLGAGGATTFLFDHGEVFGWRMTIQGSEERLLDSVLPHEITHMIFASHFRQPLPRWADEGGATSVEHASERTKHRQMLVTFLKTSRGIAFNQMFAMREYPPDVMPLYAQGFAVTDFLIQQGGRKKYLDFLAEGLGNNDWSGAVQRHYGFANLGALQNGWVRWVAQGFPRLESPESPQTQLASGKKLPRPEPNLIYHISGAGRPTPQSQATPTPAALPIPGPPPGQSLAAQATTPGWHAAGGDPSSPSAPVAQVPSVYDPVRTELTRPQPVQQPQQQVLVP